ncbi:nickel-dependent hydrogenase large subunit [Xanthobacter sp. V2C-8]|uniref:nickel-dependent hydrogenase large subunit n=1 Tax=Xanthobacter albus TaxID=3119929 RepID=UPI003729D2E5
MTAPTLQRLAILRDPAGGPRAWRFVRTEGPDPAQALAGRTAEEAARLVPLVFNLCGTAHGLAARRALGLPAAEDGAAMARESVRDHALAILHGWPVLLGGAPDRAALGALARPGAEADRALAAALVGEGMAGRDFCALTPAALEAWLHTGETATARILRRLRRENDPAEGRAGLPELTAADLVRALAEDGAAPSGGHEPAAGHGARVVPAGAPDGTAAPTAPLRDTAPLCPEAGDSLRAPAQPHAERASSEPRTPLRETGALGRMAGTPLFHALLERDGPGIFVRLLARLADLLALLAAPAPASPASPAGTGLAEAARGLLGHGARVEGGRVARYRILSPSAWNLAPGGLLERAFATLDATSPRTPLLARFLLSAINPCVPVTLDLEGASRHA